MSTNRQLPAQYGIPIFPFLFSFIIKNWIFSETAKQSGRNPRIFPFGLYPTLHEPACCPPSPWNLSLPYLRPWRRPCNYWYGSFHTNRIGSYTHVINITTLFWTFCVAVHVKSSQLRHIKWTKYRILEIHRLGICTSWLDAWIDCLAKLSGNIYTLWFVFCFGQWCPIIYKTMVM